MYIRGKRSLVPTSKTVFQATEIFKSSVHSVSFLSFFLFFLPLSLFTFFISFFLPLFFLSFFSFFLESYSRFLAICFLSPFGFSTTFLSNVRSRNNIFALEVPCYHFEQLLTSSPIFSFSRLWWWEIFFLKFLHIIELLLFYL